MRRLFLFLYQYRALLVFIVLESASFYLIIQNSNYNRAVFFNSTNSAIGAILEISGSIKDFINLASTNRELSIENNKLRTELFVLKDKLRATGKIDTVGKYSFIRSTIVNNSVFLLNNTITINSGKGNGVESGMGVIGNGGIVGKVKRVGQNYSTVVSLLDIDVMVSAEVKDKIKLCTVQWDGRLPQYAKLLFVPRHYQLSAGDTVVTSGYNAIYPKGIKIGTISSVHLPEDATFYDIEIKLINDFTSLNSVEVVVNKDLPEIDSLTTIIEE